MPARTGAEYIAGLQQRHPDIYMQGEQAGLQDSIHTVTQAADTSEFITADMAKLNQTSTELKTISTRLKDEATALGTVGHDLQKTIAWFKV